MTGPTSVLALQPARAAYVRRCATNARRLLAQIERADDGAVAGLVCAAIAELRLAEDELCWHDIAPVVTP